MENSGGEKFARVEADDAAQYGFQTRYKLIAANRMIDESFSEEEIQETSDAINAAHEAEVQKRVEEATKDLQGTLEAVEYEVAKVYCHITGGRMSKCNYEARAVISEADAETDRIVQEEVREAEDRVWEEAAKKLEKLAWEESNLFDNTSGEHGLSKEWRHSGLEPPPSAPAGVLQSEEMGLLVFQASGNSQEGA